MTGMLAAACGFGSAAAPVASASVSNQYIFDSQVFGTAAASYVLTSSGLIQDQYGNTVEAWLLGGGTASNYEVRATAVSGSVTSGTMGSWLSCGTTQSWTVANSAMDNSTISASFTISIRLASSGVVQDTATITLAAESGNFN